MAVIVGSRSDVPTMEKATALLEELGVASELRVISAHRAPALLERFVSESEQSGVRVFICAAGLAAHLPGVVASKTLLPVIGVPLPGGVADGLDALLSIVQMPRGVPVATVGVGNAGNAALLAVEMLALSDDALRSRLASWRAEQTRAIEEDPSNQ
ncbi:MAG TPA: 5-(carboxyamino)imidazole ribonucleotide mutase [Candidatus Limnocylindrales bacterium]|nr:5-(carboxyamino)imidazole ribonucleotide mutase [Candidatus Limnocylindrales bacterium]